MFIFFSTPFEIFKKRPFFRFYKITYLNKNVNYFDDIIKNKFHIDNNINLF